MRSDFGLLKKAHAYVIGTMAEKEKEETEISIDELNTWSEKSLKAFLHNRGKDTSGSISELVARYYIILAFRKNRLCVRGYNLLL